MKQIAAMVLAIVSGSLAAPRPERLTAYVIDAKQSKLEIHVYREGFLKAFGHDHLISATELSGQVQLARLNLAESSVTFVVKTHSLVVVDPGESEKDRNEVQATMLGDKVLDAARHAQIQFISSGVRTVTQTEGLAERQVDGTLQLHGVEKPVTVPVRLRMQEGNLTADGELPLMQSDYGIAPIRAGGGAVRVKNKLKISFHIVAQESANYPAAEGQRSRDRSARYLETSPPHANLIICGRRDGRNLASGGEHHARDFAANHRIRIIGRLDSV
jgi:polyisoprenoid-binding protein YceI